jgi:secreted trypsin-like serine protease
MKQRRELVIGGHDVQKGRYPYFVSIDKNNGVVLNGALIAPDIVLSAGHIALNNMDNLTIAVSAWSVLDQKKEVIPVQEWVLHPEWNQFLPGFFSNDFLIIQLAGRSTQKPVQINRNPDIPAAGQDVIITGLGWTNATSLSPATIVQETTLLTVSNEKCGLAYDPSRNLTYAGKIMPTMLCTTSPPNKTRDGCAWDSGAPVIVPGESADTDLLVALGSTGLGCADILFPGKVLEHDRARTSFFFILPMLCTMHTLTCYHIISSLYFRRYPSPRVGRPGLD